MLRVALETVRSSRPGTLRIGTRLDFHLPPEFFKKGVMNAQGSNLLAAETVPHFDWLLAETDHTCILAGGHCIPVRVPAAARLAWHKFYSSTQRFKFQDKASKDRWQATTLTSVLADRDPQSLVATYRTMPSAMRKHVDVVIDREDFGAATGVMEEVMVQARGS